MDDDHTYDDFFTLLRTYTERFKFSAATTADFIAVAEEISQQDLTQFFDNWVYSEAVPTPTPERPASARQSLIQQTSSSSAAESSAA